MCFRPYYSQKFYMFVNTNSGSIKSRIQGHYFFQLASLPCILTRKWRLLELIAVYFFPSCTFYHVYRCFELDNHMYLLIFCWILVVCSNHIFSGEFFYFSFDVNVSLLKSDSGKVVCLLIFIKMEEVKLLILRKRWPFQPSLSIMFMDGLRVAYFTQHVDDLGLFWCYSETCLAFLCSTWHSCHSQLLYYYC